MRQSPSVRPVLVRQDTDSTNSTRESTSASCAVVRTNRPAATVVFFTRRRMHRTLKIFQLNVQKQRAVQQSVMNDEELQDYAVLALSEPYVFCKQDKILNVPHSHSHWTKVLPTCRHDGW